MIDLVIDGVIVKLRELHDFRFLKKFGKVFCVFDKQDSGNICFGLDNGTEKVFIKYAGAKTVEYNGETPVAIERLKKAMPLYKVLKHNSLIKFIESFETNDGYAVIFKWADGQCMHAHWDFEKYSKYTHPKSPNFKYRNLPLEERLNSLETIFTFHEFVASKGYVAIDFYGGSIMYDFATQTTTICDIDFYEKQPFINNMGRMWGSSRFMSPEEYEMGAAIDEITNVFNMGAITFELLGDNKERSFKNWQGSKLLYNIAKKAVSPQRCDRYQSLVEFRAEWNKGRIHQ